MGSLKRGDGEVEINHQFSPGLTPAEMRAFGMPEVPGGEGSSARLATVSCNHCGGVWLVNHYRTRERHYCRRCDHYLCDLCAAASAAPGYVHRTIGELSEMITGGKWTFAPGSSTTKPILVRTGVDNGEANLSEPKLDTNHTG